MPFWEIQIYKHSSPEEAVKSSDCLGKGKVSGNCLVVLDRIKKFPKPSDILICENLESLMKKEMFKILAIE